MFFSKKTRTLMPLSIQGLRRVPDMPDHGSIRLNIPEHGRIFFNVPEYA